VRFQRLVLAGTIWIAGTAVIGCAPRPVVLHPDFGAVYESVTDAQTLNPQAGEREDPVVGIDGYAAATVMYEYRKNFTFERIKERALAGSQVAQGIQTK
jgi:hypothetical protein